MFDKKHIDNLKLYNVTNIYMMTHNVNKYGETYLKLFIDMFGKRIYGQLRQIIRHKMEKEPHVYSTRSKFM